MKFFNFTKTPKHRVFNYVPRYYDPKEDERNAIIRRAKIEAGLIEEKDMDSDVDRAKHRISRSFQTRVISSHYKKKSQRSSNLRKIGRAHAELQSRGHLVCRLLLEKK